MDNIQFLKCLAYLWTNKKNDPVSMMLESRVSVTSETGVLDAQVLSPGESL